MECKEFEHRIPDFLKRKLDYREMEAFQQHMNSCSGCKEELTIQFLVTEGVRHLEDDGDFDLDAELGKLLAQSDRTLHFHSLLLTSRRYFLTAVIIFAGMACIYMFG